MYRWQMRTGLAIGLLCLSIAPGLAQSGSGNDTVRFRDRKKDGVEASLRGDLQDSIKGLKVMLNGKLVAEILPSDVIATEYVRLGNIDMLSLRITEGKDIVKARSDYQAAMKSTNDPKIRRILEFKEAMLSAKIADSKPSLEEFKVEAAPAVDKLMSFVRSYPDTWQIWPTARTAARLQAEMGKYSDAANTMALIAKLKDLPTELVNEARLAEIEVLIRGANPLGVAPAVADLAANKNFPKVGSMAEKLKAYQSIVKGLQSSDDPAAIKAVRDIIEKTNDLGVRAAAHSALGDLLLSQNRVREAMWEYLWVETVYNQDWEEHVKAVERLIVVFDKLGEKERSQQYREKLSRVKLGT